MCNIILHEGIYASIDYMLCIHFSSSFYSNVMLNLLTIKFSIISLLYIRYIYYMNSTTIKLLLNNLTKYVLIVVCLILRLAIILTSCSEYLSCNVH